MAGSYEIEGVIDQLGQTVTKNNFSVRKFRLSVPDNDPKYLQHPEFQMENANCSKLDNFFVGSEVRVHFNITGREWTNPKTGVIMNFTVLKAWRIESFGAAETSPPKSNQPSNQIPAFNDEKEDQDIPF